MKKLLGVLAMAGGAVLLAKLMKKKDPFDVHPMDVTEEQYTVVDATGISAHYVFEDFNANSALCLLKHYGALRRDVPVPISDDILGDLICVRRYMLNGTIMTQKWYLYRKDVILHEYSKKTSSAITTIRPMWYMEDIIKDYYYRMYGVVV